MNLRDRLIKGTALNLIAVAFNQGSTLIVNIIVARILMREGFGEYAMVQSTLLTVSTLSQLATGITASRYISEFRCSFPQRAGQVMGLCAIVSAVMAGISALLLIGLAPWLASNMLKAPQLAQALMIGTGFLFFSSINGYQIGALSGLEAYGSLAKAGAASGIVAMIAISIGAWWGGLNGALIGLSISAFVRCALHKMWLRLENKVHGITPQYLDGFIMEKKIVYKFILPVAVSQCYSPPMIWLAYSFLVRVPGGYGEMALYSAAYSLRTLVAFVPSVMNSVGLSVLNNEKGKGPGVEHHRIFLLNVLNIFLVSLSALICVGFLGRPILNLFGKDFGPGHVILWLLLASGFFDALAIALNQYIITRAKMWSQFLRIVVPREMFLVLFSYYLVRFYGGVGLALAVLSATFLGLIGHVILVVPLYRKEKYKLALSIVR